MPDDGHGISRVVLGKGKDEERQSGNKRGKEGRIIITIL